MKVPRTAPSLSHHVPQRVVTNDEQAPLLGAPSSPGKHASKRPLAGPGIVRTVLPQSSGHHAMEWESDLAEAVGFALLAGVSTLQLGDPAPFVDFQC